MYFSPQANSIEMKRESRSMDNLNTAVENRAKEEERRREEERRHNEENERRRRKEEEKRKIEERKAKEERRKSGVRDSRERSPPKQVKEERRRDSKGERGPRRPNAHLATINPLLSEVIISIDVTRRDGEKLTFLLSSWPENTEPLAGSPDTMILSRNLKMLSSWRRGARPELPTGKAEDCDWSAGLNILSLRLMEQILQKLQPGMSEGRLNGAMDNLSR